MYSLYVPGFREISPRLHDITWHLRVSVAPVGPLLPHDVAAAPGARRGLVPQRHAEHVVALLEMRHTCGRAAQQELLVHARVTDTAVTARTSGMKNNLRLELRLNITLHIKESRMSIIQSNALRKH